MPDITIAFGGREIALAMGSNGVAENAVARAGAAADLAELARDQAQGFAAALEAGTAGGFFDTLAAGAADASVAEGDGYFVVTDTGRVIIGKKVSGVGTLVAEFATLYLLTAGAGSGVDADKLDGQHGAYYANIAARLGYTPLNKAGDTMGGPLVLAGDPGADSHAARKAYVDGLVTADALLDKIKTVDGNGSGLDADTVRGHVPLWIVDSGGNGTAGFDVRSDGRIECWGVVAVSANNSATWSLPVQHTAWVVPAAIHTVADNNTSQSQNAGLAAINTEGGVPVSLKLWNAEDFTVTFYIRTIGK